MFVETQEIRVLRLGRVAMSKPVRIALFNHKSGVGKTTLTANIAFALAEMGKSVLLVDSDPQCNLTSHLFPDNQVIDLLSESGDCSGRTIWAAVSPVLNGTGPGHSQGRHRFVAGRHFSDVRPRLVEPAKVGNLKLIPGDIKLAEFEEFLYHAWADSMKRRLGALRAITSISTLIAEIHRQSPLDYVFYDTGSNIGPLNRVLLLDCSFFIVPVTCDQFSVRALATLGQAVSTWITDADTINAIAPDDMPLLNARPALLGYIPQRFRVYGREMAKDAGFYLSEIKNRIHDDIAAALSKHGDCLATSRVEDGSLGGVDDLAPLVQFAQQEGVSMWECSGGTPAQRRLAKQSFMHIARRLNAYAVDSTEGE